MRRCQKKKRKKEQERSCFLIFFFFEVPSFSSFINLTVYDVVVSVI